ncbi:hypothetical protein B0H67DRAFT_79356 [Lasiosphaeris hirsuta]|uniref:Uncharacterized protein n=1 Tax=Lasiosphaeris hirsuta TaxID=260670 RepID=A0AA40E7Y2_9PEZI|nr:hypothetical protein B0H67DRAFT_79356 [Lasiosphaeris hirsuta]
MERDTQMGIEIPVCSGTKQTGGNGGEGQAVFYRILKLYSRPACPSLPSQSGGGGGGGWLHGRSACKPGSWCFPARACSSATARHGGHPSARRQLGHRQWDDAGGCSRNAALPGRARHRADRADLCWASAEEPGFGVLSWDLPGPWWRLWTNRGESGEGMKHRRALVEAHNSARTPLVIGQWDPPCTRKPLSAGRDKHRTSNPLWVPFWRG